MKNKNKFYITTPIYYASGKPHLGTLYSSIVTDIAARWHKLLGKDVFFLTGTDEFGQKIEKAAKAAGSEPKKFVDSFVDAYKETWQKFGINYDKFIRTTDSEHIEGVQYWIKKLEESGDIYKSAYDGWYCTPCERFLTPREAGDGKTTPNCPTCERETSLLSEECYFFKLSKYQDKLLKFYEDNPNFITPKERLAEAVSFVREGLADLSISRTTISWGVPFPSDEKHVTYVWADALNNYITAIGYSKDDATFKKWWPADLHVMAKEILRFHAVYWPAFLMAAGIELPKRMLVHGWITVDGKKMSKSLGNVTSPDALYKAYGPDPVRLYLAKNISIAQDGQFSIEDLEEKISADLADSLGNLLRRVVSLAKKHDATNLTPPKSWPKTEEELCKEAGLMVKAFEAEMSNCFYHKALGNLWIFIAKVNAYIHGKEPWKQAKQDREAFTTTLSAACHSLKMIGTLLWPVMPEKMTAMLKSLGLEFKLDGNLVDDLKDQKWNQTFALDEIPPLFQKYEPNGDAKKMTVEKKTEEPKIDNQINFDDFLKVNLNVGTIVECEDFEKSDKLLKMAVDFGEDLGIKQVMAGIKKLYQPSELIGKQAVFVTNLKPRKIMGLESQAMLLLTSDGKLTAPTETAVNGASLG